MTIVQRPPVELDTEWVPICPRDALTPLRGVAALIDGRAIAVFLLADDDVVAIDNLDPCSGTSVLSRGLVGDADGVPTVASPMYKQRFDLRTGQCLDAPGRSVTVHRAMTAEGSIHVQLAGR